MSTIQKCFDEVCENLTEHTRHINKLYERVLELEAQVRGMKSTSGHLHGAINLKKGMSLDE